MGKAETISISCDRCKKTHHRPRHLKSVPGEDVNLNLAWLGKIECSFTDLCPRCFEIVQRLVDALKRVTKEEKDNLKPKVPPPLPVTEPKEKM